MVTKNSWWDDGHGVPETRTVLEQDKPEPVVIYDHTGQPYHRPRCRMGFALSGKKDR